MNVDSHATNRVWAFEALDALDHFLQDPDYSGEQAEDAESIDRRRRELREGKYRVVFLGAFNVGKSMLINALLGDEYLPTVLEECTTKIVHIHRADAMRTVLRLNQTPTDDELGALLDLIHTCGIGAEVDYDADESAITIAYAGSSPGELLQSLRALVTVSAEEDFPELRTLRAKYDEMVIQVPNESLQEDIALVDSPGVHSVTETNQKISDEIIPNSHLVVCLIDSQSAGHVQNRDFVTRVVEHKHRKVFFVINKSDQLNPEEIDARGRRGPAKDLLRVLDGVVEMPELFFVSGLYALVATQLEHGRIDLDDLDKNNKIKIPFAMQRALLEDGDLESGVSKYLLERSDVVPFRNRLLDYLYRENREMAILESVCQFLDDRAWRLARPLETKLDMVRNNPRLEELARRRGQLEGEIGENGRRAQEVLAAFDSMAAGEAVDGRDCDSYEMLVDAQFTDETVAQNAIEPLERWLGNNRNLRQARRNRYEPLKNQVENTLDMFIQYAYSEIGRAVADVEERALAKAGDGIDTEGWTAQDILAPARAEVDRIHISLARSYATFALGGLVLGAVVGTASMGSLIGWTFIDRVAMGAGAAAAAGIVGGLLTRAASSRTVIREMLNEGVAEQVKRTLLRGMADDFRGAFARRRDAFHAFIEEAFAQAVAGLRSELDEVTAEEDRLRKEQQEQIDRLEPKVDMLVELGRRAQAIASGGVSHRETEIQSA
ncbi:MAG: hypothetical protein GY851_02755 [bacterium]|nr:hypothetical protein [bacterium]